MIEITTVKNANHLFKSNRMLQKEKKDLAVFFSSAWDAQSIYINNSLNKAPQDLDMIVLVVDSFETPELFSINERTFSCTKTPACFFYRNDRRIREYKIYREVTPSRILEGFSIFE
jgi:hypothetical protein